MLPHIIPRVPTCCGCRRSSFQTKVTFRARLIRCRNTRYVTHASRRTHAGNGHTPLGTVKPYWAPQACTPTPARLVCPERAQREVGVGVPWTKRSLEKNAQWNWHSRQGKVCGQSMESLEGGGEVGGGGTVLISCARIIVSVPTEQPTTAGPGRRQARVLRVARKISNL